MPKEKPCKHEWVYDGRSCCYRLICSKCPRGTTAYHIKGRIPKIGEKVQFTTPNGETIKVIE